MKMARAFTKEQEKLLRSQGLHPEQWLLVAEEPDKLIIITTDNSVRTTVYKVHRRCSRE